MKEMLKSMWWVVDDTGEMAEPPAAAFHQQ
jgi:hypothetical protein